MFWRRAKFRERDLERELRAHLDLEAEERLQAGEAHEQALYAALADNRSGGAALDEWRRYPTPVEPLNRPSQFPFQELPNVLMTSHCSSATDEARDRRLSGVARNIDRFVRGEALRNVVLTTT